MANVENSINYIEFPMTDPASIKAFYNKAFGWEFTDWGLNYISFNGANVEGGFNREEGVRPEKPGVLVILYANNLEEKLEDVRGANGKITQDIYSFPGGRRFHFQDPNGNELAIWSEKEHS